MGRIVWDEAMARSYAAGKTTEAQLAPVLDVLAALRPEGRCLDVGAGHGPLAIRVASRHAELEVVALDPSETMVELGEEAVRAAGLEGRVRYVRGTADDAALLESLGTFDVIVSSYALHFFEQPAETLRALAARLRPGGTMVLVDLRRVPWPAWVPVEVGFFRSLREAYTTEEVRALLPGLEPAEVDLRPCFPYFLQRLVVRAPVGAAEATARGAPGSAVGPRRRRRPGTSALGRGPGPAITSRSPSPRSRTRSWSSCRRRSGGRRGRRGRRRTASRWGRGTGPRAG